MDPKNPSTSALDKTGYKSFKAKTFEELDGVIRQWLHTNNKQLATISCWHDGTFHYAMIGVGAVNVAIVNGEGGKSAEVTHGRLNVLSF
jgi:hypothetical protein